MATAQQITENDINVFDVPADAITVSDALIGADGKVTGTGKGVHLKTKGMYVDRDIHVNTPEVTIPKASFEANAVSASGWVTKDTQLTTDGTATNVATVEDLSAPVVTVSQETLMKTVETGGYAVTSSAVSADGSVKAKATAANSAGYFTKDSIPSDTSAASTFKAQIEGTGSVQIAKGSVAVAPSVEDADVVVPSVAVSHAESGFTASTAETPFYVTISNVATAGNVKATATVESSEGYIEQKDMPATSVSSAKAINATVTGADDVKVYIPAGSTLAGKVDAKDTQITSGASMTVKAGYYDEDFSFTAQKASDTAKAEFGYNEDGGYSVTASGYADAEEILPALTINETAGVIGFSETVSAGAHAASETPITAASMSNGASLSAEQKAAYADVSASAPVLISGDYLYIEKGGINKIKISLAQLVPDDATITVADAADYMLDTKTAYDNNGVLMTGAIKTYAGEFAWE